MHMVEEKLNMRCGQSPDEEKAVVFGIYCPRKQVAFRASFKCGERR